METAKAKKKAFEDMYGRLGTKEGEKELYQMAKQQDRDRKDIQQVRVIKDASGEMLTEKENVIVRWKEYFEGLLNKENQREERQKRAETVENNFVGCRSYYGIFCYFPYI